jgi:hypothetical protein
MNAGVGHRKPSLVRLVWPLAFLPLSGWLIYLGTRCPGNPTTSLGVPIVWVAAVYLTPPLLLAALILTLRSLPSHRWLRAVVAIGLGCGFLVACYWGLVFFAFTVMGECI